ncbi:hypothetical protein KKG41_04490 [Patescibacteria group bacterium]|nr:hypothetical protein [Patescibacteria group bacterium]MBU1889937.1 hypothetical protein [Patescibacteria group bacterium]
MNLVIEPPMMHGETRITDESSVVVTLGISSLASGLFPILGVSWHPS